jgi:predicted transcriptional regulator
MQNAEIDDRMNRDYEPTDDEDAILEVMKDEPCGRVNPYLVREETELSKQRVSNAFRQLVAAGWVDKRTRALYDLDEDPREEE